MVYNHKAEWLELHGQKVRPAMVKSDVFDISDFFSDFLPGSKTSKRLWIRRRMREERERSDLFSLGILVA